jgi:hypothetical protein
MTEAVDGLNHKVAQVLTNLGEQLTALGSIVADFNGIRGPDNLTLGDLKTDLYAVRLDVAELSGFGLQGMNTIIEGIGLIDPEDGDTILSLLKDLRNNIGLPTGDATTTLLGRLASIEHSNLCGCGPQPPSATDPDGCASPAVSDTQHAISGWGGRTFAVWSSAPDGALIGTGLDPSVGNAELVPEATFDGWTAFVLSRAASVCSLDPSEPLVMPTNQWINISGRDRVAFSVAPGADIVAYICSHLDEAWTDCVDITSTPGTYSTDAPFSEDAQFIVFSSIPGVSTTNTWIADGQEQMVSVSNTVVSDNWHGVVISLLEGTTVTIYTVNTSGGVSSFPINAVGDSQTLTFDTQVVMIHNLAASSPHDNAFQVRICPPA